jgi:hypothetical protein
MRELALIWSLSPALCMQSQGDLPVNVAWERRGQRKRLDGRSSRAA